jgi:predicted nucleic acid-binding protein
MRPVVLADTGPLVALLDRRDQHHAWAVEQFKRFAAPLYTCEAVLAETAHLVPHAGVPAARVMELVTAGAVAVVFDLGTEAEAVAALLARYHDVPMDLADACLVRMSELREDCRVLTLDGDFRVYRRNRNEAIGLVMP